MSLPRPSASRSGATSSAIHAADERYVTRRQFAKFLVLTSFGMLVGNLWILVAVALAARGAGPRPGRGARGRDPGGRREGLPLPGLRTIRACSCAPAESYVAYSQKCTHLSLRRLLRAGGKRLECPCHEGYFSVADGRVLQGPPPRPLPRILLERAGRGAGGRSASTWATSEA